MPVVKSLPSNANNKYDHYDTYEERQEKAYKNYDSLRNYNITPIGSTITVQPEDGRMMDPWNHHRQR